MTTLRYNAAACQIDLPNPSKRDEIAGPQGDRLKIRVKSPPVDGKANKQLCDYLATTCQVPKQHVIIRSGEHNQNKSVCIKNASSLPEAIFRALFM